MLLIRSRSVPTANTTGENPLRAMGRLGFVKTKVESAVATFAKAKAVKIRTIEKARLRKELASLMVNRSRFHSDINLHTREMQRLKTIAWMWRILNQLLGSLRVFLSRDDENQQDAFAVKKETRFPGVFAGPQ